MRKGDNTKYNLELLPKIFKWASEGIREIGIANNLGIRQETLINWKKEHPELVETLKEGKEQAIVKVENSLYKRANGFKYKEKKVVVNGNNPHEEVVTKYVIPDVAAQTFILKNRLPEEYKDRQSVDVTGEGLLVKLINTVESEKNEPTEPI